MIRERNIREEMQHGKLVLVFRKKLPDRTELRRNCPDLKAARKLRSRVEAAINGHAKETWQELKNELDPRPVEARPDNYTFKAFRPLYWEEHCLSPRVRCPQFHRNHLDHIDDLIGERTIRGFTPADCLALQNKRAAQGVKNSTVNRTMSVLSGVFRHAHKIHKLISENPMADWEYLPEDEQKLRIPTRDEVNRLIERAWEMDPLVGAYLRFLKETGLREEEALGLERTALDLTTSPAWVTVIRTKNRRPREVPLSEEAVSCIHQVKQIVGLPYVFARAGTRDRLRRTSMYVIFKQAARSIGCDWAVVHDLRHFCCTVWCDEGVPLNYVQKWMGHRKIETTMRYAHYSKEKAAQHFREFEKRGRRELPGGFAS